MSELRIGALSTETGVKVPTIRYYENIALMPVPRRTAGNRRTYNEAAVKRLRFIRHARELGFDLSAIRGLLRLADGPDDQACVEADAIASARLADVESKIARLGALRKELVRMADCTVNTIAGCRVIEILAAHNHNHPAPEHPTAPGA